MQHFSTHRILFFFLAIPLFVAQRMDAANPSLTIYNQNFGVVRENIPMQLKKGLNQINFTEITSSLEPGSVILRDPAGKVAVNIIEQTYRNDPASEELLLSFFEGKEISFQAERDDEIKEIKGTIVRAPLSKTGISPIVSVGGQLQFFLPGRPVFPNLSDDSILKPTLNWTLQSDQDLDGSLQLSYITAGFSWLADYNLVLPEKGNTLTLIGWITLKNNTGRNFENAKIKLLAGDVQKFQNPQPKMKIWAKTAAADTFSAPVEEKAFDEYHLYTLARPLTLRDRQTTQVEFIHADNVAGKLIYIYDGSGLNADMFRNYAAPQLRSMRVLPSRDNKKVGIYREFENSEKNNLGIPLPKGRVRFYRTNTGDDLEFIGENQIDHTPRNETLKIYTGDAFDLVGERIQTNYTGSSKNNIATESFEIKLRNRKEEAVTIRVVESLLRNTNWEITEASAEWKKVDSQQINFNIEVPADGEKTLTYTVRYTW
ncbi:MAG: DUF4139 domain-containing protein [Chthoniobacterales bacterium]